MTSNGNHTASPKELITRLGGLLMALVAGEDLRVRHVIARGVMQVRSSDDLKIKTRWHARQDPAANPPVE